MSSFLYDIRIGFRKLIKTPLFTAITVLILAVGIGANTAVFTVVNEVTLKPLPYPNPDQVFRMYLFSEDSSGKDKNSITSGPKYLDYRGRVESFESLACYYTYREIGFDYTGSGQPIRLKSLPIQADYFDVLGYQPFLGRTFTHEESFSDDKKVILSYEFWETYLQRDRDCIGKSVTLDGFACTIVGVMPSHFVNLVGGKVDLWSPIPFQQHVSPSNLNSRPNDCLSLIGRLKPGVSYAQAQAELDVIGANISLQYPDEKPEYAKIYALHDEIVGSTKPVLYILFAAVGLVLLTACFNIANLLIARSSSRQNEIAVRAALGSSRSKLVAQFLAEYLILAFLGGILGLFFAAWLKDGLLYFAHSFLPQIDAIRLDWSVYGFCFALIAMTMFLFGLIPALQSSKPNIEQALRTSSRRTGIDKKQNRFRNILTAVQIALAVVLLVGAGLLHQSFFKLMEMNVGFDSEQVMSYEFFLPAALYETPESRTAFYRNYFERIENLPDVRYAGSISKLPVSGQYHGWAYQTVDGSDEWHRSNIRCVDGQYFGALDIPLRYGRSFNQQDTSGSLSVIVISRSVAERHWKDEDPVGESLVVAGERRVIAGVVEDTRHAHRESVTPIIYIPHAQFAANRNWTMTHVVRTRSESQNLMPAIREELAVLDPNLVIHHVKPLDDVVSAGIAKERFVMVLMNTFAGTALFLSVIGLYGVLSFFVSQRTAEVGIRMALGAGKADVLRMVLREGVRLSASGVGIGIALSLIVSRTLAGMVYGIAVTDFTTYALVVTVLTTTTCLACFIPARRAVKVNPITALRCE